MIHRTREGEKLLNGINWDWLSHGQRWQHGPVVSLVLMTRSHIYGVRLRLRPFAPLRHAVVFRPWHADLYPPFRRPSRGFGAWDTSD